MMILTEQIFNNLNGKATHAFDVCNISTYLEIGVREGNTFDKRVPLVRSKSIALDCWDLFESASQNDMDRSRAQAESQYLNLKKKYDGNSKVEVIRSFSNNLEIVQNFDDNYFDLIFVDGDHSYEGAKEDLNNWWPKCNTLFCGHDYMLTRTVWNGVTCGVKQAVDEFVIEKQDEIKLFRVHTKSDNPTWFIWKK